MEGNKFKGKLFVGERERVRTKYLHTGHGKIDVFQRLCHACWR